VDGVIGGARWQAHKLPSPCSGLGEVGGLSPCVAGFRFIAESPIFARNTSLPTGTIDGPPRFEGCGLAIDRDGTRLSVHLVFSEPIGFRGSNRLPPSSARVLAEHGLARL
jgi:hypothetical protein